MKKVAITGANGYVASWIVKKLIDKGYAVHGTVRSLSNEKKIAHLKEIKGKGTLKLFEADLLQKGSFDEAFKGCDIVMHTASPFFLGVTKDPYKDFIDPALKGTENALRSCSKHPSIKKVVLTSSEVAMCASNKSMQGKTLDENSWNEISTPQNDPYSYSKKVAEERAWEMAQDQSQWKLVTINPGGVFGPSLAPNSSSGTVEMIRQLARGEFAQGVPNLQIGMVDVQDVADAHIEAAFNVKAEGRYLLADKVLSFMDVVNIVRPKFESRIKLPPPNKIVPKFLVWLMAPKVGMTRQYVSNNIGYPLVIDNTKSKRDLGITYDHIEQALNDHLESVLEAGR